MKVLQYVDNGTHLCFFFVVVFCFEGAVDRGKGGCIRGKGFFSVCSKMSTIQAVTTSAEVAEVAGTPSPCLSLSAPFSYRCQQPRRGAGGDVAGGYASRG